MNNVYLIFGTGMDYVPSVNCMLNMRNFVQQVCFQVSDHSDKLQYNNHKGTEAANIAIHLYRWYVHIALVYLSQH